MNAVAAPVRFQTGQARAWVATLATVEDPGLMGILTGLLTQLIPGFGPVGGLLVSRGLPAVVSWLATATGPSYTAAEADAEIAKTRGASRLTDAEIDAITQVPGVAL